MTVETRIIKRYANRKLYDTEESRYVTLEQIADMIREGHELKVVDNSTKEDLTSVTLAQIIYEEEKQRKSILPLSALRKIIQSGGGSIHDLVSQIQESAGRVGRVFRRDDEEESSPVDDAAADVAANTDADPVVLEPQDGSRSEPVRSVIEFFEGVQGALEDWQKRMDANVHNALENVLPLGSLQKEMTTLRERIAGLEKRLFGRETGSDAKPSKNAAPASGDSALKSVPTGPQAPDGNESPSTPSKKKDKK